MDDRNRVVDLYNKLVLIYNNINVINENINQMIDCLKVNFTINGSIAESNAIYAAQAKLLAVRDNINSELLEYMENYL